MKSKINFTDNDIKQIVILHNNGMLNREIAEIFNVSVSSISRLLQKKGLSSKHPSLTQERINKIIEMGKNGYNRKNISKELHTSDRTVKTILDANGIVAKTASERSRRYTLNEDYFKNVDSHEKAYWLGLLYSDGTISKSNKGLICLALQEKDKHILESFSECLNSNRPLGFVELNKKIQIIKIHFL